MKKKTKSFGGAVAAGSALAGAALGAAAVVLSDKKNQAKIKKTIDDVSHEAIVMGKKLKKKAEELKAATQKNKKKTARQAPRKSSKKTGIKKPVVKK